MLDAVAASSTFVPVCRHKTKPGLAARHRRADDPYGSAAKSIEIELAGAARSTGCLQRRGPGARVSSATADPCSAAWPKG